MRPGERVLDVAGGTGDLARLFARRVGAAGEWCSPTSTPACLRAGAIVLPMPVSSLPLVQCDAERLPFRSGYFDCVCDRVRIAQRDPQGAGAAEMTRVLRPGGRLLVLEFSRVWAPLRPLYDAYSFQVLPRIGRLVRGR